MHTITQIERLSATTVRIWAVERGERMFLDMLLKPEKQGGKSIKVGSCFFFMTALSFEPRPNHFCKRFRFSHINEQGIYVYKNDSICVGLHKSVAEFWDQAPSIRIGVLFAPAQK